MRIEIKTKGNEDIPNEVIEDILHLMDKHHYKNGSIKQYRICDACECELPSDYPEDLCPNCKDGQREAMLGSI